MQWGWEAVVFKSCSDACDDKPQISPESSAGLGVLSLPGPSPGSLLETPTLHFHSLRRRLAGKRGRHWCRVFTRLGSLWETLMVSLLAGQERLYGEVGLLRGSKRQSEPLLLFDQHRSRGSKRKQRGCSKWNTGALSPQYYQKTKRRLDLLARFCCNSSFTLGLHSRAIILGICRGYLQSTLILSF